MRANDVTAERVRELAGRRAGHGKVLSLFLDLTPSEFATRPRAAPRSARCAATPAAASRTAISTTRSARACATTSPASRTSSTPPTCRPRGPPPLAVYASGPADLLEVFRLPQPVPTGALVGDAPNVGPLADAAASAEESWCAALVSRGTARSGSPPSCGSEGEARAGRVRPAQSPVWRLCRW